MKSKIGLLAIVIVSGLVLSACTNKGTIETNSTEIESQTQQEQSGERPSETADRKGPGQQMDLAAAAEKIGVTEEELRSALGMEEMAQVTPGTEGTPEVRPSGEPKQMDLAAAAETLGVTEDELKEALGMDNMPSGGPQGGMNGEKPSGTNSD